MRWSLFLTIAAAVVVGALVAPPAQGQCIALLYWHGRPYHGNTVAGVQPGPVLASHARQPNCNDHFINGKPAHDDPDRSVKIRAVRGVDPGIAIMRDGWVYVSASTFPSLPSHPLHKQFGLDEEPRRVGNRCTVSGPAKIDLFGMTVNGARIIVSADTDVALQRYGTGYVANGQRVNVAGQPCERQGGVLWISATRIS